MAVPGSHQPQWTFFPALNYDKIENYGTTYGLMNLWRGSGGPRLDSHNYNFNSALPQITQGSRTTSRNNMVHHNLPSHLYYNRNSRTEPEDFKNTFQRFQNKGMNPTFPLFGTPRMRYGRAGGSWRHVREVTQAMGSNTVFVDGIPKVDDNHRIVYRDVEYANVIQPKATCKAPIQTMTDEAPRMHKQSPVYNTTYAVDQTKGFEKNNWMIVR